MKNWRPRSGEVFVSPEAISAEALIALVDAHNSSATRKRDLKSAIRSIARVLGIPVDQLPIDPVWLRPKLDAVVPAAHGLTEGTWGKRLSEFGQALKMAGIGKRLAHIPLSGVWADLRQRLRSDGDTGMNCWLSPLPALLLSQWH